jgi:hypothetical protein
MSKLTSNESDIAQALTVQAVADQPLKTPTPPVSTCNIKDVLPASVIQMAESFPQNETVRSVLCAHLKAPVPAEAQTFQQIRDWIETHVVKENPEPFKDVGITLLIEASRNVSGTCHYSVTESGDGDVKFSDEWLKNAISDSGNLDDLFGIIRDEIEDRGGASLADMSDEEGTQYYTNHERTDTDNEGWDLQRSTRTILINAVRRLRPDIADEWDI